MPRLAPRLAVAAFLLFCGIGVHCGEGFVGAVPPSPPLPQSAASAPVPAASAPDAAASAPVPVPLPGIKVTRSFEELGSPRQSLKLMGISSAYSFSLPVSPREKVNGGTLHLQTTNSTALILRRSEVSVTVNGQILAQYQLDPERTQAVHDVELASELLKPGYNEIRIAVVQHYTNDCENPLSPELWTQIDGKRSGVTLNIEGALANGSPRLTQLSTVFDRRGWLPRRLAVVSGSDALTEVELSAAGLAVQGLSLRLDYRPLGVDAMTATTANTADGSGRFPGLSPQAFAGRDVLLVGKRAEVSRYMDQTLYGLVSGPFVGIFPANEGDSVIIVVSGSSDEELLQAARSLGNPDYKYADMPLERVSPVGLPPAKVMGTGTAWSFDTFGFRTQTLNMKGAQSAVLEFRAPGHFAARKGDVAALSLHISYSAALRKASNLDVYLNDTFIKSIALDNEQGADIPVANIKIPAQYIKPGYNTLTFESKLLTASEQCDHDGLARGSLTVFEDSKFELPEPTVTAKAPDLERYARSLWPHSTDFNLVLTNRKPDTASAALELMALIAQKNRAAVELRVFFAVPATGHATLVGPFEGLPDSVQKAWPLNKYQWVAEGSHMGVLQALENNRVLTGFFARDTPTLRAGIELLRAKGFWRSLAGSAAVIDTQEQSIRVEGVPDDSLAPVLGDPKIRLDWRIWLAAGAFSIATIALLIALIVRRRIRSRQARPLRVPPRDPKL